MNKLLFIVGLLVFVFSCRNNLDTTSKITSVKKLYSIETTTYWDIPNTDKDTIPFIELKIDTINHIGRSNRFSENGEISEQIVIIGKAKAIKLNYYNDSITSISSYKYYLRKDHPTKDFYSIVIYK